MMGGPRPPAQQRVSAPPTEHVDQNDVMMSKPAARKKKQVEKEDRLPSVYMFDEEDAEKQRAKDPVRAAPQQKPKQTAAPREPPRFEDYYQEEPVPKRSERLFESFTTEQQIGTDYVKLLDERSSFASQAPAQPKKQQTPKAAIPDPSFDDPFGVGSKKKSKPIKKKEKLFFDDTEDESASEIDYRPQKKAAPPQQTSIFA